MRRIRAKPTGLRLTTWLSRAMSGPPSVRPSVRSHDLIPRSGGGERGAGRAGGWPPQLSCIWRPSLARSLAPPSVHSRPPNEVTLTRMTEALDLGLTDGRGRRQRRRRRRRRRQRRRKVCIFCQPCEVKEAGTTLLLESDCCTPAGQKMSHSAERERVQRKCKNSRGRLLLGKGGL